ncbi:MAG: hypothetical protein GEV06_16425 [Luteitalea sp.]|nr:hypothetical protein [Luteitalea sp.]
MPAWERRSLHVLTVLVTLTGVVYLWMKYAMATDDPFAVVNHPLQPLVLAAHILASPALLLVFGLVLQSHVLWQIRTGGTPNRKSGYVMLSSFGAMALSGYLLQVVTAPAILETMIAVHVIAGVLFAVAYLVHLIISARLTRERRTAVPRRSRDATAVVAGK